MNAVLILVIGLFLLYLAGTGKLYPLVQLLFLDVSNRTDTNKIKRTK